MIARRGPARRLPSAVVSILLLAVGIGRGAAAAPLPIRVVVVTTFEIGADTGDAPGEFQEWVERLPLSEAVPFPQGYRDLRLNRALGVLGIVTGEGPTRAAASIEALGNDPRFDLSHAYMLLAGIAGVDPTVGSPGSAFWAPHVVDGDLAHEIDAREIPPDWPTGYVPLGRSTPFERPAPPAQSLTGSNVFTLNPSLVAWAYGLTRTVALPDTPVLRTIRARYAGFPAGQRPPVVGVGDTLAATAEEDAGMMQALTFLAQVHRVDLRRVLVLRTASNFDMPPPGETPAALLASENRPGSYSGYLPSLDAAFAVGSPVVRELATHWDRYADTVP